MTLRMLLFWLSALCGAASLVTYLVGLWRRWQKDANGRFAWVSDPRRAREPWLALSVGLLLSALALQIASRLV